ncbi:hypothetical protein JKF63_06732 [Porcisia hertigi]|uniref:Uncharacterized protein n=1 Tax=Porcisia hertigi TaxID=2761500 RepID=A0A836LG62_9TRYP|nr:hypothetical protein JKF63_06732 [Porcisia hertigi]
MERGGSNVAASLLATELKGDAQFSENLRIDPTNADTTNGATESIRGRRRATRTQVQSLLEDQRRFALHDGVTFSPFSPHTGNVAASDYRIGGGASSRLPDMFGQRALPAASLTERTAVNGGLSTSTVATALRDAVPPWCASLSSVVQRGVTEYEHSGGGGLLAAPHVRRSWRLLEATHQSAVPSTSSASPSSMWCIGQRWKRVDDVSQANALAHAVWTEMVTRRAREQAAAVLTSEGENDSTRLYASGLQMCYNNTHSTASLPAFLMAASADVLVRRAGAEEMHGAKGGGTHDDGSRSSTSLTRSILGNPISASSPLAFFTFTESEYDSIAPPPPPSTRFTYASSCYLVQLWERFGNPIVLVDRWRWSESGREVSQGEYVEWTPSVEEVCAEYHRVTAGILQQRRQRLLVAFQMEGSPLPGASPPAPSPSARTTRGGRGKKKATTDSGGNGVDRCASTAAVSRNVHPFVASFDRYALLQPAEAAVPAHDAGATPAPLPRALSTVTDKDGGPSASFLSSQPSPPPPMQPSLQGSSTPIPATVFGDSEALVSDAPATPPSLGSTATAQQRLTMLTTPNSWFAHNAEVHRRACLARLLQQEQKTNVPYQQAANRYLALAASTALALQRAVFAFYDRDDEARFDGSSKWMEAVEARDSTGRGATEEASVHLGGGPCLRLPCRPPRRAFTVQLQPLPSVDPAAWRTAEATVRKASEEVLGTLSSVAAVDDAASLSQHSARAAAGVTGSQKRARSASRAHVITGDKRRGRVAVLKSAAESVAADAQAHRNDTDEVVESEASAQSDSGGEFGGGGDEQEPEGSLAGEEADEGMRTEVTDGQRQRRASQCSSPTSRSSRLRRSVGAATAPAQASHLPVDATYTALQSYLNDVLPFRCARLRGVVQAGWLLPAPHALPHSLTNPIQEEEVCTVDTQLRRCTETENPPMFTTTSSSPLTNSERASVTDDPMSAAHAFNTALLDPILTEEEYEQLRKVSASVVCNRIVSHTDEAVLLSLPATVPRLHREVEQELERYLYDDASVLMEVNPMAQSLVDAIRVAYTQNTLLLRFATRLEHVLEGLKKVSEESVEGEAETMSHTFTPPPP